MTSKCRHLPQFATPVPPLCLLYWNKLREACFFHLIISWSTVHVLRRNIRMVWEVEVTCPDARKPVLRRIWPWPLARGVLLPSNTYVFEVLIRWLTARTPSDLPGWDLVVKKEREYSCWMDPGGLTDFDLMVRNRNIPVELILNPERLGPDGI